jgi:hypothetical protein
MRVGTLSDDFNINTYPPVKKGTKAYEALRNEIVAHTRKQYGIPKKEVEEIIHSLLPQRDTYQKAPQEQSKQNSKTHVEKQVVDSNTEGEGNVEPTMRVKESLEESNGGFDFKAVVQEQEEAKEHQKIQREIKKVAQGLGFLSTIEKGIEGARRIDVLLERTDVTVAVEVSVSNTIEYEIENIRKCLAHTSYVVMTSPNATHLNNIEKKAKEVFDKSIRKRLHFCAPKSVESFLQGFEQPKQKPKEKIVNGYRVKVTESDTDPKTLADKMSELVRVLGAKRS